MSRINKTVQSIKNGFIDLLTKWSVDTDSIRVRSSDSPQFKREIIEATKEGIALQMILYVQELDQTDDWGIGKSLRDFSWNVSIFFFVENKHKINLKISRESIGNKVGKLFGKRDLEVYNEEFDKKFWVESNHDYAYAILLDEELQALLLKQIKGFTQFIINNKDIRYKEAFDYSYGHYSMERVRALLNIGFQLAKNLNGWNQDITED